MKKITSMILALVFAVSVIGSASAKTLKIQLTFPKTSYDGQIVKMWTDRVTKLTRGELKFELLSKGEVVGMKETLEAVDKGLVDGGAPPSTRPLSTASSVSFIPTTSPFDKSSNFNSPRVNFVTLSVHIFTICPS